MAPILPPLNPAAQGMGMDMSMGDTVTTLPA